LPSSINPDELRIRPASAADYPAIAELTVAAYRGDGQTGPDHPYEPVLADVGARAGSGVILVCADSSDQVLGAVLYVRPDSPLAEVSGPGEAEFRMLAVSPAAQRRGVGEALVHGCVDRARAEGRSAVVICVRDFAHDARRLYKRLGFTRDESIDWSPADGITLLGLRYQL
jgi:ribosomal protein S18 acetylase RimI-like enzyme